MDFVKGFVAALIFVSACGFIQSEIKISFKRSVQDFGRGKIKFSDYMMIDRLRNLKWAEPNLLRDIDIKEKDFVGVYEYLKARNRNFFIFPDYTIFYGLLDKPSPQPVLWFFKGATYPKEYDARIDQRVVDSLRENDVEIIVLEGVHFLMRTELQDFPLLRAYIDRDFVKKKEIGIFSIYERTLP